MSARLGVLYTFIHLVYKLYTHQRKKPDYLKNNKRTQVYHYLIKAQKYVTHLKTNFIEATRKKPDYLKNNKRTQVYHYLIEAQKYVTHLRINFVEATTTQYTRVGIFFTCSFVRLLDCSLPLCLSLELSLFCV